MICSTRCARCLPSSERTDAHAEFDKVCKVSSRPLSASIRVREIKGVDDVLAGRVEQGIVKPGEEMVFLPTHTALNLCTRKVFKVEIHHQRVDQTYLGDQVGLNIKGLDKNNMLDKVCKVSFRPLSAPMRLLITGIHKIKEVGDALAGRVKQGIVKPDEVVSLPTHTALNLCTGKVFTIEVHQRMDHMYPGDNVGLNIKGLDKNNTPCSGDDMDMLYKKVPPWARPGSSTREEVVFLPTHTASYSSTGKVFTVEVHQQMYPSDNVGLNIKGLDKNNIPCSGDDAYEKVPPWVRPGSSTRGLRCFVKSEEEVVFLSTHMAPNPRTGKVLKVEVHQRMDQTCTGDNEGFNIKGLDKNNMPCSGDDMVYKRVLPWAKPGSSTRRSKFSASRMRSKWVFVRCGRDACRDLSETLEAF